MLTDEWHQGLYDVANGPLEAPGRTSLYLRLTPVQGGYAGVDLLFPPQFSGPAMDVKNFQNKNTNIKSKKKIEGLGSPFGDIHSVEETSSSKMVLGSKGGSC